MLSAWSLVGDQLEVAAFGGVLGLNWARAREPLKSAGFWDEARDCIPEELLVGLRIIAGEFAAWRLCEACRQATKKPSRCSRCGDVIVEPRHQTPVRRSAEDELRAELEAEGDGED